MRKGLILAVALTLAFIVFLLPVHSALVRIENSLGEMVVHDEDNNRYWVPFLGWYNNQNYQQQVSAIETLNNFQNAGRGYFDLTGWRMATYFEVQEIVDDHGIAVWDDTFVPSWVDSNGWERLDGRTSTFAGSSPITERAMTEWTVDQPNPSWIAWPDAYPAHGAWVTTDETIVPIPGAVWLLGSGLLGLIGIRRKLKK